MIQRILQTSPAVFIAFVTALVTFLVGLGLITQAHADSVVSIAAVVIPVVLQILAGFFIHSAVFSPKTTQAIANRAALTGNTDIGSPPKGDQPAPNPNSGKGA